MIQQKRFEKDSDELSIINNLSQIAFKGSPIVNSNDEVIGIFYGYNIPDNPH
jgi:hypothetical protein